MIRQSDTNSARDTDSPPVSSLAASSTAYVESLLEEYLRDPTQVSLDWRRYFRRMQADREATLVAKTAPSWQPRSVFNPPPVNGKPERDRRPTAEWQRKVDQLVHAYRTEGHLAAHLDPLEMSVRDATVVDPAQYGLAQADDDRESLSFEPDGERRETLGALRKRLTETYCGSVGFQYMHISDRAIREWLRERIENPDRHASLSRDKQLRILERLTDAVIFERFVRKKYVGAKTFSLEGAETLIPLLDLTLESAAQQGVKEVVMGMAHRGRLNVLANIVGKRPIEIFREFEDQHPEWWRGKGDVKYHLGASGDWQTSDGSRLHVSLCFNPSHLEFVDPVVLGRTRAKQLRAKDSDCHQGMAILIHGDAGFSGEGIVQESLNLSDLEAYHTGGALHVVVNNQLGFTTSPAQGRSTRYPTDIAKPFDIPIFHVNGEQPHAVAYVVNLAMEYRATFRRDVVIDMYCYRRWGHNEADEPSFTQPLMYQAIEHRPSVRDSYLDHLLELGQVKRAEADRIADEHHEKLKVQFREAQKPYPRPGESPPAGAWEGYGGGPEPADDCDTGVDQELLRKLLDELSRTPEGFQLHKKLRSSIERRRSMAAEEEPLDWSAAEALAFATLAVEGYPVRLAGQDTQRGTFSQRHAVLHDVVDGHEYSIFQNLHEDQARVEIVNTPLSEVGALGFEYGFSLDYPDALCLWEAQYGDFVNAGQVIIDQFITSAEDKWRRLSGLVLLLPHGFEGKGPEHSSARVERFLTQASEDNIQVVCPTTPAQYFHVLRRQVLRKWRKPLIVLTPKSLLRDPRVVSRLADLERGQFQRVLQEPEQPDASESGVILTSGKMYYDLLSYQKENQVHVPIVRIEQFYPLRDELLAEKLAKYPADTPIRWVQEEPENMGAWPYWKYRYCERFLGRHPFSVVARPYSASPATGSSAANKAELADLLQRAFELPS